MDASRPIFSDLTADVRPSIRRRASVIPVLAAAHLAVGCGSGDPEARTAPAEVTVRDSAGIEIVESPSPLWGEADGWTVEAEPSVVIRSEPEDSVSLLHSVGAIVRLSDGRVVVENKGTQELLVFDSTGASIEALGGRGEGPGEFGRIHDVFPCGEDRVLVRERTRVTILDGDTAGWFVRTNRVPDDVVLAFGPSTQGIGASDDCQSVLFATVLGERWLLAGSEDGAPAPIASTHGRAAFAWAIYEADTRRGGPDTLGVFRMKDAFKDGPGGRLVWISFYHEASVATDGASLYYGWGEEPEVEVLDWDRGLRRIIRWGAPAEPITDADWEAFTRERIRFAELDPLSAPLAERSEQPKQETKPYFVHERLVPQNYPALQVDVEGNLWVRRYTRPSLFANWSEHRPPRPADNWWILDPDGRWLGEVETPANFIIRTIRDGYLHGVSRDEYDVEEVRLYRIVKR